MLFFSSDRNKYLTMSSRNFACFVYDYFIEIFLSGVQISMRHFLCFAYFLPFLAFIICISLTIVKDNTKATSTHCNVTNFLPSISAIIGGFEPQRFIWRFSFALDSTPRYIIGYLQLQRLLNRHHVVYRARYRLIQIINSSIHFLELTFLLLLTYVSSNEIKRIHVYGFIGFMMCSLCHMLCTILIDYYWPRTKKFFLNEKDKNCRTKRFKWFIIHLVSFLISLYFFYRHNHFCEPYIYSMFCSFEYLVVLTNIGYHSIIREEWDHKAGQIQFYY